MTYYIALLLYYLCFFAFLPSKAQEQKPASGGLSDTEVAKSNNPLAAINQISFHNFFSPEIRGATESANTMHLRGVIVSGRQIIRGTLPIITVPTVSNGENYTSGLGDFSIFDAIKLSAEGAKTDFAIGPQLVIPTATNDALGTGKWQAGGAFLVVHHIPGGHVLGALTTYQHSFAGDDDRTNVSVLAFQPTLTFNIVGGFYGRSAGATWAFDLENNRILIPFAIGAGKVFRAGSAMVNMFVEPQMTVYSKGEGQPAYQIFFGMNLQWAKQKVD